MANKTSVNLQKLQAQGRLEAVVLKRELTEEEAFIFGYGFCEGGMNATNNTLEMLSKPLKGEGNDTDRTGS